jgi:hypothetical protein
LQNCGLEFPHNKRITVNLAPADLPNAFPMCSCTSMWSLVDNSPLCRCAASMEGIDGTSTPKIAAGIGELPYGARTGQP